MTAVVLMGARTYDQHFDEARLARLRRLSPTTDPLRVDDLNQLDRDALDTVEVILTGWGAPRLDRRRLDLLPRLSSVIHCAGSVKSVVTPHLWQRDIQICSAAEANAIPVAEYTFAAIIMAGKKAPFLAADARRYRQDWTYRRRRGPLSNLGLTVGIIGFSRIGRKVVARLQQLDDVTCVVSDPYADAGQVHAAGARLVDLHEMLGQVDVLSIHAPELPSTRHLIAAAELAELRDHTTVINTARGSLIDTAALEAECAAGRLNAILDVTDPEPLNSDSVLYDLSNVMITPHIAGSLDGEVKRMTDTALDELERLRSGHPLRHRILEAELDQIA